ncbi:MAG: LPS assembly lipoprotein LptE [Desulfobulbus sp.]|jgi:hypothetical protein
MQTTPSTLLHRVRPGQGGLRLLAVLLPLLLLMAGCGYYSPYAYDGTHKTIYMPPWKNRTNKLDLDMQIYQGLAAWFQKSRSIALVRQPGTADYDLAGEIVSISLPSIAWAGVSDASGTKVQLYVRYVLKDRQTGQLVWEVPGKLYTADFDVQLATSGTEDAALKVIIADMAEDIYIGAQRRIRMQTAAGNNPKPSPQAASDR